MCNWDISVSFSDENDLTKIVRTKFVYRKHRIKLCCLPVNSILEESMIQTEIRAKISLVQLL